jgi:hypothetical protein
MFRLFYEINGKLWWRSLRSVEIGAVFFYSLFLLLIFGQFLGVAMTLLFAPDMDAVREAYPWYTEEVQLMFHLVFVNLIWFAQLFYTKISRLRLNDNRKLLALGMPIGKLTSYLNLAGFFHPVNLMFNLFWIIYLGLMTSSMSHLILVALLIIVNYGLINSFKWRFKRVTSKYSGWSTGALGLIFMVIVLLATQINLAPFMLQPETLAPYMNQWLIFSPGMIFYSVASGAMSQLMIIVASAFLALICLLLLVDLNAHTQMALLTPAASSEAQNNRKKSGIETFFKWLGHQGGKYFYTVWNHPYSKTQIILTYVFVIPYIAFVAGGGAGGGFLVSVLLTLIPVIFLMVLLANMFGFENRELLLSLQAPVSRDFLIIERFKAAVKITMIGLLTVYLIIPFLYDTLMTMVQVMMGVLFICMIFVHYVLNSSMSNYKKIESVSLMSVSNPVVPASVNFTGMVMVLILGALTFPVLEGVQMYHILALAAANVILAVLFIKKLDRISNTFNQKVIPHLWNEL